MISILQNEVERLRGASIELAHDIEAFLNSGGTIEVLEGPSFKPRERSEPPPSEKPVKKFLRRQAEVAPLPMEPIDILAEKRMRRVEQVMALAPTHTQTQVCLALNMTSTTLRRMSQEFGFKFKKSTHGGSNSLSNQQNPDVRDAQLAERITAFRDLGISRRMACSKLTISYQTLERIVTQFNIDYPKLAKGPAPAVFAKQAQQ
jgi:transposase